MHLDSFDLNKLFAEESLFFFNIVHWRRHLYEPKMDVKTVLLLNKRWFLPVNDCLIFKRRLFGPEWNLVPLEWFYITRAFLHARACMRRTARISKFHPYKHWNTAIRLLDSEVKHSLTFTTMFLWKLKDSWVESRCCRLKQLCIIYDFTYYIPFFKMAGTST